MTQTKHILEPPPQVDDASLGGLYRAHAAAGLRLALLLERDHAAAEDLLHDAFVRASGYLGGMRDAHAFGAYLRRTIITMHSSARCRRKLERERSEAAARQGPAHHEDADVVMQQDLWTLVCSLPARQRAVVFLRFYEDLSERATAEIMNCTPRAVRAMVHRAMTQLRIDFQGGEA